jgi:hypothetical protein
MSSTTVEPRSIDVGALREGDVVLSRGTSWISRLILGIDGGAYSHAAYYDGALFIQAMQEGVRRTEPSGVPGEQQFLDVYRFKTEDGRSLGREQGQVDPQPITAHATNMLGRPFAFDDIGYAARMIKIRRRSPAAWDDSWAAPLRAELERHLREPLDPSEAKLTCTELVSRSFWYATESGTKKDYGIHVTYKRNDYAPPRTGEYAKLQEEVSAFLRATDPQFSIEAAEMSHDLPRAPTLKPGDVIAGSPELRSQYVTPYDLETSASLTLIGRLWSASESSSQARGG